MQVKAGSRDTMIGIIYRPPNQNSEFFTAFPKLLENVWLKFSNIVLLGDFNTNLLQNERGDTSYEGKKMEGILVQFNLKNVIEGPTRITSHSKTLIDLIVTNRKDLVKQKGSCPLGISDHDMIYATLLTGIPRDPPKIITIRNFNKFSERNFQSDIARAPFQVCEVFDDPTDVYYSWNPLFTELCNEHAPFKQIKVRSNSLPWITKEIRTTMNHRYKALKKARELNDPLIWDDYRRLRNKVSTMTKKAKADYYSNLFDEVKTAAAYWRLLKKASGTTKVNRQARQLKKDDGTLTTNDTEKANMLNDYFCTVAEKLIGPADEIQPLHAHISEIANTLTITSIQISQKEIEEMICKLKVKKATGPDGVPARLLKSAGKSIAPSLTGVFRHSAETCKPPDQWKIARVSAAFKKGREEDRTCYRPLSMLSIPSKLMESCVASTITNHVVTQNLLDSRQWAYRKGKSTEQLLIHLTERWREAAERRLYVGVLFIDFTKAFDTVSHKMLLQS